MSHVFISYSKKNKTYARRVADYLREHGFDIWIDDRIDYGQNWLRVMVDAVRECATFVVIMTPESEASRWVELEVLWALQWDKPIFPILRSGENWPVFVATQYADCRDGSLPDSRFVLELSSVAPSRQVGGRDITPSPVREQAPQPLEEAEPPADASSTLDVFAAIGDFMRLRTEKRWTEARRLLVRLTDEGDTPSWFDVQHYMAVVDAAIEAEKEQQRRQERDVAAAREYAALRVLAEHDTPERVWTALQLFWETYEGYDPDGLAEKYRPTTPVSAEVQRLLDIMLDHDIPPEKRTDAGKKLAEIGDPRAGVGLRADGVPDIDWVEIPGGPFIYGDKKQGNGPVELELPTFWIARYPITYKQFQAFIDADDGFHNSERWKGLDADDSHKQGPGEQRFKYWNHPRERVSWWDAVAFCKWLSEKLGYEVTLPTEQQWERAARGKDGREYPWGPDYISGYANIDERYNNVGPHYLGQTSAVGTYPQGASPDGVLDMSGNVWEWCLNEYEKPENTGLGGAEPRVLRGGSWSFYDHYARCASRFRYLPFNRYLYLGFRVCAGARPMP